MAETPTRPTPAPWRSDIVMSRVGPMMEWSAVRGETGLIVAEPSNPADAALIVAACNACQLVNPANPMVVADALPELIRQATRVLRERSDVSSILLPEYWTEHYVKPIGEMLRCPVKYAAYRAAVDEAMKSPAEVQRRKDVDAMFDRIAEERRRGEMIELMD